MEENTICYVKGQLVDSLLVCLMTERNISALHPFCVRVRGDYIELGRTVNYGGFEIFSNGILTSRLSDNDKNNFEIRIRKCYDDNYEVYMRNLL